MPLQERLTARARIAAGLIACRRLIWPDDDFGPLDGLAHMLEQRKRRGSVARQFSRHAARFFLAEP